jgi:bacteriorhodopsin
MKPDPVLLTTYASILAQLATGAYALRGANADVPPEHDALKLSLDIEMGVQLIELLFYLWLVGHFDLATMAKTRYKDWAVSTPLMLVSAMLYFSYEKSREEGRDTTDAVADFFATHTQTIAIVVAANLAMIVAGYAGEVGWLPTRWSLLAGFAAFGTAFHAMWSRLASQSKLGRRLFRFIAAVWSLYGVAFVLPAAPKNVAYNLLDVVAKNFFGVFLALKVVQAAGGA